VCTAPNVPYFMMTIVHFSGIIYILTCGNWQGTVNRRHLLYEMMFSGALRWTFRDCYGNTELSPKFCSLSYYEGLFTSKLNLFKAAVWLSKGLWGQRTFFSFELGLVVEKTRKIMVLNWAKWCSGDLARDLVSFSLKDMKHLLTISHCMKIRGPKKLLSRRYLEWFSLTECLYIAITGEIWMSSLRFWLNFVDF
jgi:hypothetical protein